MRNSQFLLTTINFSFLSATQRHGRSRWGKGGGGWYHAEVVSKEQRKNRVTCVPIAAPSLDTSPPPPAQWSCKYYHNLEVLHPLYFLQSVAKQDAAKDKPKGAASQNDKKTDKNADKNNENKEASLEKDLDELKKAIDGTCAFKRLHSAFLNCSILCWLYM